MNDTIGPAGEHVEAAWQRELARGDAVVASAPQMLRHFLDTEESALFTEVIVARVRGMLSDMARQLAEALGPGRAAASAAFAGTLADHDALLDHLHALALETQVTERLRDDLSLDPVLSPLVQALIASDNGGTSETAMRLLAAQARFVQNQRRMQLPLTELPADLLYRVLLVLRRQAMEEGGHGALMAEAAIRARYDEGATRLGLAARLVTGMGGGVLAGLALPHAGVALFVSALALMTGQGRDLVLLALHEDHGARLALSLRAAGLAGREVEGVMLTLGTRPPEGLELIGAERAAALLAANGAMGHRGRHHEMGRGVKQDGVRQDSGGQDSGRGGDV